MLGYENMGLTFKLISFLEKEDYISKVIVLASMKSEKSMPKRIEEKLN